MGRLVDKLKSPETVLQRFLAAWRRQPRERPTGTTGADPGGLDELYYRQAVAGYPAEVIKDYSIPNAWRVEKLDSDGDGGIDVAIFDGPDAEWRAREYAAWKYGSNAGYIKMLREQPRCR